MAEYIFDYDGWAEQMRTEVFGIAWCFGLYKAIAEVMHERKRERIVRCRDCKHCEMDYTDGAMFGETVCWAWDNGHDYPNFTSPDGFCYRGERKEVDDG